MSRECKTHVHVLLIRLGRIEPLHDLIARKTQKAHGPSEHRPFLRRGHITRNRDSNRRGLQTLEIIDVTPNSSSPPSCLDVAQPKAHSDFLTLILQFQSSAPQLDNRYLQKGLKKRTQPTDNISIAVAFCRKAIVTHASGSAALYNNQQVSGIAVSMLSKLGLLEQYASGQALPTSKPPHPQTRKQHATSPSSRKSMNPETEMKE